MMGVGLNNVILNRILAIFTEQISGCLSCGPIVDPRHMLESIFLSKYYPLNLMHADLPSGLHHDSNQTRVRLGHVLHVKKKQLVR